MTTVCLSPDAVFDGKTLRRDIALRINGDVVELVTGDLPGAIGVNGTVSAGFVDLQVNGGGGVLLNTRPTVAGLHRIAAAHRAFGTVRLLPTVISDTPDVLDRAVDAVITNDGAAGILGLHIEGPHIAEARRGTHAARFLRPMDDRTMSAVERLRLRSHAVMITVAPEMCTPDQIAALADMGAVVSIGHSDCDAETLSTALAAGARCGTHLFNAMSQMTARAPGVVGGLLDAGAYAGLICDGHHVSDAMIAIALRAQKTPERLFLVSDAMPTVGGPDRFTLFGEVVGLNAGRLVNAEGNLAGAHLSQAAGLGNLVNRIGIAPDRALSMVTRIPAEAIGLPDLAEINGRHVADLVVVDNGMAVRPLASVL